MSRLFVYGSLKRGEQNHRHLAPARFVGEARTTPSFELLDLGEYPAMKLGGRTTIVGEVYELDEALLAALDRFEGHPDLYRRTTIALDDGAQVDAYLVVRPPRDAPRIASGAWSGATSRRR